MYLLNSWGRVGRQPTLRDKLFHRFLLIKIHSEECVSDSLQLVGVAARLKIPPHSLQLEKPSGGHSHNGSSSKQVVEDEEAIVYSTITFYSVDEIPDVLAIVRFITSDDHERVFDVSEAVYPNTPDGYCQLEQQVPDALANGVDIILLSHLGAEDLPEIYGAVTDLKTTQDDNS